MGENIGIGDLVKITNEFRTASRTWAAKMRGDLQNRPKMMNNNNTNAHANVDREAQNDGLPERTARPQPYGFSNRQELMRHGFESSDSEATKPKSYGRRLIERFIRESIRCQES